MIMFGRLAPLRHGYIQKSAGVCTFAYPGLQAFALPTNQDKQLSQPTSRMYIYRTPRRRLIPYRKGRIMDRNGGDIKHHPWTPTVAVSSDWSRSCEVQGLEVNVQ